MVKGLSPRALARAALDIVDAEGLETLTMRRLAAFLGVDPMAAYRHLPNKEALLDAVLDEVLAEIALNAVPPGPWHERLRAGASAVLAGLLRHPRAVPLLARRTWTTPRGLAVSEWFLRMLVEAGIDERRAWLATNSTGLFLVSLVNAIHGATVADPSARLAAVNPHTIPTIAHAIATGRTATYHEMLAWWLDLVEADLRAPR